MRKIIYVLLCGAALMFASCDRTKTDDSDSSKIREILKSGGTFAVLADKYEIDTAKRVYAGDGMAYFEGIGNVNSNFYTQERKYDIASNPEEFAVMNPWSGVMWPGCIMSGESLNEGVPSSLPFSENDRLPMRIYLDVVSGNQDMDSWYRDVDMRESNVHQSMNDLLKDYLDGKDEANTPAQYNIVIETVNSVEDMALKLGANAKIGGAKLNADFQSRFSSNKSYVAVKLQQIFYTMTLDPGDVSYFGFFNSNINPAKFLAVSGPGDPLCYVKSVSFGRVFIMLYESESTSQEINASVSAAFKQAYGATVNAEQMKAFSSSKVTAVQYGGDAKQGFETVFGSAAELKKFITNGAYFGKNNIAKPISCRVEYLYNNRLARITNATKYTVTERFAVPKSLTNSFVLNVKAIAGSSVEGKKFVDSDGTYVNIESVKVKRFRNEIFERENVAVIYQPKRYIRNGFEEGINNYAFMGELGASPAGIRIQVEAKLLVTSKTRSNRADSWVTETVPVTLNQIFSYNSSKGIWEPSEKDSPNDNPYRSIQKHVNFPKTAANCDVKLYYQVLIDGQELIPSNN